MIVLELIVLLAPGMIALVFNGYDFFRKGCSLHFIAHYFVFELLTLIISYGIIMLVTSGPAVVFSGSGSDTVVPSLYSSRFVVKFSALLFLVSMMLGTLERRYHRPIRKIYLFLWKMNEPGEAKDFSDK